MAAFNIPTKDADLLELSKRVFEAWNKNETLNLIWTSRGDVKKMIDKYAESFSGAVETKATRRQTTQALNELDKTVDQSIKYLKAYIDEQHEDAAVAYYEQYGIYYINNRYMIPTDREARANALLQTASTLEKSEFKDRKYGYAYWAKIANDYTTEKNLAANKDSERSGLVTDKKTQKLFLTKWLDAMKKLVAANYPDDIDGKYREWGFHGEKG